MTVPRPQQPPAVSAIGVVKLFGSTPALIRVSLDVPAGTVAALVGGNGAGKTTLLRVLATAVRPTAGTAHVLGLDVLRHAQRIRALVDLMPSGPAFYSELSARENLRFAARMRGDRAPAEGIDAALETVGLAGAADDRVRTYSTGMLRRLAIARLRVNCPAVALLDEPYGGLDEPGRELVDRLLLDLRADGRTALVATHERARMEAVADAVHRLERGIVVEQQPRPPAEVAA
jgi:ABC-type multidrug transport system ATPase subunit